jgi:MG2 domain
MLLLSVVSISILAVMDIQSRGNYAFAQTVRTTELKVNFKKIVESGSTQNIRTLIRDQGTGLPISGSNVRLTIYYPGGAPIRQFNLLSDANGLASLSLPISRNAPLGQYGMDVFVSTTGYLDTNFGTVNWAVMSHAKDTSLHDYTHAANTISGNHRHHNSDD